MIENQGKDVVAVELVRDARAARIAGVADEAATDNLPEMTAERGLGPVAEWDKKYTRKFLLAAKEYLERERDETDDPSLKAEKQEQIEQIDKYLARATNIHGRPRLSGDPGEKARKSVLGAVNTAKAHIRKACKPLADHLDKELNIGIVCRYEPDPPIPWQFS